MHVVTGTQALLSRYNKVNSLLSENNHVHQNMNKSIATYALNCKENDT